MNNLSALIATCQIGITMLGIAVGALTEPYAAQELEQITKGYLDPRFSFALGFLLVSLFLVVLGELAPKYATLAAPERTAIFLLRPLYWLAKVLKPLIWITEKSAYWVLRPFGIPFDTLGRHGLSKEELLLVIQANGDVDQQISDFVAKILRLNALCVRDVMVHRLDVKWIESNLTQSEALKKLAEIPFGRVPVCEKDVDGIVGVIYAQDIFRAIEKEPFHLSDWMRPVVFIPESLTLDKVLARMRESQAQLLVVADEYGGTSGIVTLEDISEEIFGDLEDTVAPNYQTIQKRRDGIYSAKASVRLDELADYLGFKSEQYGHQSLATIIVETLNRVPRRGDEVDFEWGKLRVMSLHRRRIQQVEIRISKELQDGIAMKSGA